MFHLLAASLLSVSPSLPVVAQVYQLETVLSQIAIITPQESPEINFPDRFAIDTTAAVLPESQIFIEELVQKSAIAGGGFHPAGAGLVPIMSSDSHMSGPQALRLPDTIDPYAGPIAIGGDYSPVTIQWDQAEIDMTGQNSFASFSVSYIAAGTAARTEAVGTESLHRMMQRLRESLGE